MDALSFLFTSASIKKLSIQNLVPSSSVQIKAGDKFSAQVQIEIYDSSNQNNIHYTWRIMAESTDKKSGGDVEEAANEISGLILKGANSNEIVFRAPNEIGYYRLFVSVIHNGKVAYANIPFQVLPRAEGDKQSRFIQFKYTDMQSFEK